MSKVKLSVLDLCPILSGETATESLRHPVALARFVEELGYNRYWVAEHHDMEGIGSSAPEVLIAHIASATKTIRVGSGGIMLPNHSTYHMAEVFKTLSALYPGRIDMGLGRAPGSGSRATVALRRGATRASDDFPKELDDLIQYFQDELPLKAVPLNVSMPEVWMLGSSDFGGHLAAHKGLPYSFAQHFSNFPALEVIRMYREEFRSSPFLREPYAMMGCHIICAETDEEAEELALSSDLSFLRFFQTGKNMPLPTVEEAKKDPITEMEKLQLRNSFPKFVGSPERVKKHLAHFLRNGVDELMIFSSIYDQKKRMKSYELISKALN